tara:strand:+ start:368 stop:547 length:180 start_codon:yes stop_codon:yes gene_type:complete
MSDFKNKDQDPWQQHRFLKSGNAPPTIQTISVLKSRGWGCVTYIVRLFNIGISEQGMLT